MIPVSLTSISGTVKHMPFDSKEKVLEYLKTKLEILDFDMPIIYSHPATPESFLFKADYLNRISLFSNEEELLRIGNEPLKVKGTIFPDRPKQMIGLINVLSELI